MYEESQSMHGRHHSVDKVVSFAFKSVELVYTCWTFSFRFGHLLNVMFLKGSWCLWDVGAQSKGRDKGQLFNHFVILTEEFANCLWLIVCKEICWELHSFTLLLDPSVSAFPYKDIFGKVGHHARYDLMSRVVGHEILQDKSIKSFLGQTNDVRFRQWSTLWIILSK